ncbi:MAG TPA: aa3-type cytochrome c oxidase subunit IV [Caulobacteraceae bacterium]|jgi:uncharacterized membrane protein
MADEEYHRGEMDIHQHELTFRGVMRLTKWACLIIAVMVLFFSMWLAAGAGFFGSLIAAVVVLALGIFLLRSRPRPAEAH